MSILMFLRDNAVNIFAVLGAAVSLATAVVAMTPSKKDDEVVGKIAGLIDKARGLLIPLSLKK